MPASSKNDGPASDKDYSDECAEYIVTLARESDRGVVLLIAVALDEALGDLHLLRIASHVRPAKKLYESLTRPFAPLSSLASKIHLAYSYGMIDKALFEELELVRRIRNGVAHNRLKFTFDDPPISKMVLKLRKKTFEENVERFEKLMKEDLQTLKQVFQSFIKAGIRPVLKDETSGVRWHFIVAGREMEGQLRALAVKIGMESHQAENSHRQ